MIDIGRCSQRFVTHFVVVACVVALCSLTSQPDVHGQAQEPAASQPATAPDRSPTATQLPAFETDFDAALAKAKSEGKVLLLEFYRQSCPYCQRMVANVYPKPELAEFSKQVVWVRIDQEQGEGPALRRRFRATSTPYYIAVNHDGQSAFFRYPGGPTLQGFLHNFSLLPMTSAECDAVRASGQPASAQQITLTRRWTLARCELMKGKIDTARSDLRQIADDDPQNTSGIADDALVMLGLVEQARAPREADALGYWLRVMKQFPKSDRGPDAVLYVSKMLRDLGDRARVVKLNPLLKNYPEDVDVEAAARVFDAQ